MCTQPERVVVQWVRRKYFPNATLRKPLFQYTIRLVCPYCRGASVIAACLDVNEAGSVPALLRRYGKRKCTSCKRLFTFDARSVRWFLEQYANNNPNVS